MEASRFVEFEFRLASFRKARQSATVSSTLLKQSDISERPWDSWSMHIAIQSSPLSMHSEAAEIAGFACFIFFPDPFFLWDDPLSWAIRSDTLPSASAAPPARPKNSFLDNFGFVIAPDKIPSSFPAFENFSKCPTNFSRN